MGRSRKLAFELQDNKKTAQAGGLCGFAFATWDRWVQRAKRVNPSIDNFDESQYFFIGPRDKLAPRAKCPPDIL
ncbi:hypothetical protein BST85_02930 [Aureitalea marina]|uniref:Uncharacterized protein n=1 Tax=Aureitalea marina TaxID=930804 RepID=A0A2S7KMX0_9FLAO|nr:hypothetical protein BST85_02930 [Aureitalea marina]